MFPQQKGLDNFLTLYNIEHIFSLVGIIMTFFAGEKLHRVRRQRREAVLPGAVRRSVRHKLLGKCDVIYVLPYSDSNSIHALCFIKCSWSFV